MSHQDLVLFGRVGLAFVLCYAVGFERALRGAPAGDRTYSPGRHGGRRRVGGNCGGRAPGHRQDDSDDDPPEGGAQP